MKFVWSNKCEEGFLKLKNLLTNAPTLLVVDSNQGLVVYIDAHGTGVGAVMMQKSKVIMYAS